MVTLARLEPSSAQLGQPSFTLRCLGSGFQASSVILWAGSAEPTIYVSDGELQTTVDMDTAVAPAVIAVSVLDDSTATAPLPFTITEAGGAPCPVTPMDVAEALGGVPVDERLEQATDAACQLVAADLAAVYPVPCPEPIRTAIIGCAVDLYRLPTTAFGYFVNDVGIASTGTDVLRRWRSLLDPYRMSWGLA